MSLSGIKWNGVRHQLEQVCGIRGICNKGLASCKFALVVLSESFFDKNWPEYEFRGLVAREIAGGKVILPLWRGVTREEVLAYSPPLADKLAIRADDRTIVELAVEIISVVRPDLHSRIGLRAARLATPRMRETIPVEKIEFGPPLHSELPAELLNRIRLVRAALIEVDPHSMDHWVDGFRRDTHPSQEVRIWERVATCHLEFTATYDSDKLQRAAAYKLLLTLALGGNAERVSEAGEGLPTQFLTELVRSFGEDRPIRDIDDELFPESYYASVSDALRIAWADRERFPDIPDELLTSLVRRESASGDGAADVEQGHRADGAR